MEIGGRGSETDWQAVPPSPAARDRESLRCEGRISCLFCRLLIHVMFSVCSLFLSSQLLSLSFAPCACFIYKSCRSRRLSCRTRDRRMFLWRLEMAITFPVLIPLGASFFFFFQSRESLLMDCSCGLFFIVIFVEALFIAFVRSFHFGLFNDCSGVFFVFFPHNHTARWSPLRSVLRSRHSATESRRGLTEAHSSSIIPIITAHSPQCMVSMLVFTSGLSKISLGGRIRAKGNNST